VLLGRFHRVLGDTLLLENGSTGLSERLIFRFVCMSGISVARTADPAMSLSISFIIRNAFSLPSGDKCQAHTYSVKTG